MKTLKLIENYFIYDKIVCEPSSGTIYMGSDKKTNNKHFVQVVTKKRFEKKSENAITNFALQISFLKDTFCEQWLSFINFLESSNTFYIVTESPSEPVASLKSQISKTGPLVVDDRAAFSFLLQMLKAYIPFCARNQLHFNISSDGIFPVKDPKTNKPLFKFLPLFHYDQESLFDETVAQDFSFLPPEIIKKTSYGSKSDMYSIALVLFEGMFGVNPFSSEDKNTVLKKIEQTFKNIFPKSAKFSEDLINLILNMLDPNIDKRINWKDLFKSKFFFTNINVIKNALKSTINGILEGSVKTNGALPIDLIESLTTLKQNLTGNLHKTKLLKIIESSGEFELIDLLRTFRLYEDCKNFYSMKIFDDEMKGFQQLSTKNPKLPPQKARSLFVDLDQNRMIHEKQAHSSLLRLEKQSEFPKHDIIPSASIKSLPQAKKTMIAKYLYQRESLRYLANFLDSVNSVSSQILSTSLMVFAISKISFYRFQSLKETVSNKTNIFDLPYWEELIASPEFTTIAQNCSGDLFNKFLFSSFEKVKEFKEINRETIRWIDQEVFFMQVGGSVHQQLFMEIDLKKGFKLFAIRFLKDLMNLGLNESGKNKAASKRYFILLLKVFEVLNYVNEFGISKIDKEARWDFLEIWEKIDGFELDDAIEEAKQKMATFDK